VPPPAVENVKPVVKIVEPEPSPSYINDAVDADEDEELIKKPLQPATMEKRSLVVSILILVFSIPALVGS